MSETALNRTYTPPPVGSFDPLTAAITGTIPSFYTYGPPRPRTPSAPASGGLDTLQPSDGGGGGDGGGLGSGGVNMGGEMAGSIDLGPNPGNLGSGTLGNLSNIDFSNVSLSGGLRGAGVGGAIGGLPGAIVGALAGAFGPAISDARNAQETARAQQAIHDRAVEAMFAGLDPKGIGDVGPNEGPVSSPDKSEPGTGGEKGDTGPGPGAPGEASTSGGDMGGGPSGDSGDGYKEGGLVAFQEGGAVTENPARRDTLLSRLDNYLNNTFLLPQARGEEADRLARSEGIPGGAGGPRDAIRHMVASSYTNPTMVAANEFFGGDMLNAFVGDNQARWDRANNAMGQRMRSIPEGERYGRAKDMVMQQLRHIVEYGEPSEFLPSFDPRFTVTDRDENGREIVYGPREIIGWIESGRMPPLSDESRVLRSDIYAPRSIGDRLRPASRRERAPTSVPTTPNNFAEGGLVPLAGGGKIAIGPGGGLDDLIPTSINGRQAAALSDGEFVIPADVVSMMGDGSSNAGARRLYDLVRQVRDTKTGTTRQAGPLPVGEILKRSLAQ